MSPGARVMRRPSPALVVEASLVALLGAIMLAQLLFYEATRDPDPDGYVSYARSLVESGRLPASGRMPGYPLFLIFVARPSPDALAEQVYWVQLWLTVAFCLLVWLWVRRRFGPPIALCLLGIFAAPCYFLQVSIVMLPDGPYGLLAFPLLLVMGWWVLTPAPRGDWLWLPLFALAVFVLQLLRPTTVLIVGAFVAALLVGWWVRRRVMSDGQPQLPAFPATCARAGTLLVVALLIAVVCDQSFDTGARRQNTEIFAYRVVTRLPPASDSDVEQRVEQAKERFRLATGQAVDHVRFGTSQPFGLGVGIAPEDALAVWQARLTAHPGQYLLSILDEIRHDHHLVARLFVPYFVDQSGYSLFDQPYPPDDGTRQGDLFRLTGLLVLDRAPYPAHWRLTADTITAIAQLVAAWGLLGIGAWRSWYRDGAMVVTCGVAFGLFVLALAATNTIDGRYLLPFVPLIYLGQAIGVAWIAETLVTAARLAPAHLTTPPHRAHATLESPPGPENRPGRIRKSNGPRTQH